MTRIFLLDDHHIVRDGLRSVLEAAGHVVVGDAAVACGVIESLRYLNVEVLILDIHLKGESGLELLQSIGAAQLNTKVLILSMSAEPRHVSEAMRLGAMAFVLKGSPASELLNAIVSIQQGTRFLSPQVEHVALNLANSLDKNPLSILSTRELEILKLVVSGRTSASIATDLGLSPKTVDTYRSRIMTKLDLKDIPALVRLAIQYDLIQL
jgi:two-component system invasion response regulator UvrY